MSQKAEAVLDSLGLGLRGVGFRVEGLGRLGFRILGLGFGV